MARIVVTSDIHYDDEVDLTPPATVAALVERIAAVSPDAVVLAGDLGHPLRNFTGCLRLFGRLGVPLGVVAGNHDIWRDPEGEPRSAELFFETLPATVRAAGAAWLESDAIVLGRTAIVGSLVWYDYSAVDPSLQLSFEQLIELKQHATNDWVWVDLPWSDQTFSARLRRSLVNRLESLEWDERIDSIFLVTHVPLFEEQMVRRTDEASWGLLRAYFGNFTTGQEVLRFTKLKAVVSGHTHRAVKGRVVSRPPLPDLAVHVVGSDYGEPAFLSVDMPTPSGSDLMGRIHRDGPPLRG